MLRKPFLKIVHLEDNTSDAELIKAELEENSVRLQIQQICSEEAFKTAIQSGEIDVVLSDSNVPGINTWDALQFVQKTAPHIPFIFVSGNVSVELKTKALCNGAIDYVAKDRLSQLTRHVQKIARWQIRFPDAGKPVMVQCEDFSCLAYLDRAGIWRDFWDSTPLANVTAWEEI